MLVGLPLLLNPFGITIHGVPRKVGKQQLLPAETWSDNHIKVFCLLVKEVAVLHTFDLIVNLQTSRLLSALKRRIIKLKTHTE